MNAPRAVVFDLGKVLVDFDYGIAAARLGRACGRPPEAMRQLLDQSPLLFRYETGQMTTHEFFASVRESSGFAGDLRAFAAIFADIFSPIEPMLELHAGLRARGVPTFIFSNTNELAVAHIRANFPFFRDFDGYVLSYEQRSMKPQAPIYEAVERHTGRRGPELLYLDDREENVAVGRERGWHVIHHQAAIDTVTAVKRHGLI
jgi:HAD superfamily hydrolase (TIGR01509 family)